AIIPADTANKLVVLTGPEKADFTIPSNDEILEMANKAAQAEVKQYEEKAVAESLMARTPTPGKIVSEKENKDLGITTIQLNNGVTVILKPTDFKNDQVVMSATRFGGQYLFDAKDRFNAEYAASVVSVMGVGEFAPIDL